MSRTISSALNDLKPLTDGQRLPAGQIISARANSLQQGEAEQVASISLMQATVARLYGVSLEELRAPTRCKARIAFARQVAMYLSHVVFGMSLAAVGRHFGRDRTTAAHACRCIEDRRDDYEFDRLMERIEQTMRALFGDQGRESACWP